MNYHAAIWLDHRLAKIIGFNLRSSDWVAWEIHSHSDVHIHHKAGVVGAGRANQDLAFFRAIADKISEFQEVLIVGPAETKGDLVRYLKHERPAQALHVSGVEALERRTNGEIADYARDFFKHMDRMTPQI